MSNVLVESTPPHWAAAQTCIFQMSLMLTEAARHEFSLQLVFATNPEPSRLLSQKGNMT